MRIFANARFRFIEARRSAYIVSAAVLVAGITAMVVNVVSLGSWQNYGVDFTGGSLVQVAFLEAGEGRDAAGLREALGGAGAPDITRFGSELEFVIRTPVPEGASIADVASELEVQLVEAYGPGVLEIVRTEAVTAKVGGELQTKALNAILFSFLLTLVYLAFRFELRFGLAAVIATAHDIMITLGFLALFRVEIALATVAAILTIVGYSLNDTIVVFDRIRENLNRKGGARRDPVELVNASINETLPRTVLTSGTTLAVLFALLLLGGSVIRDFTLVLILGVIVGTYSSIFVASPALIEIQKRFGRGKAVEDRRGAKPRAVGARA